MVAVLIVLFVFLAGLVIYAFLKDEKSKDETEAVTVLPLSERSIEELRENLQKVETDIEMGKIEYQGQLSNPYVSHIIRNMSKQNLEFWIEHRISIINEINRRSEQKSLSE